MTGQEGQHKDAALQRLVTHHKHSLVRDLASEVLALRQELETQEFEVDALRQTVLDLQERLARALRSGESEGA